MKKFYLAALGFASILHGNAQMKEGKVVYEIKMNMHKDLPPEAEQFKAMIPEFNTSKMELSFKGQQSLYKKPETDDDQMPTAGGEGGGGGRRMFFGGGAGGGNSESFKDYDTHISTDIRELGPTKYLLDDTIPPHKWKLMTDTLTILGHLCHKATTTMEAPLRNFARRFGGGNGNGGGNNEVNTNGKDGQNAMVAVDTAGRKQRRDSLMKIAASVPPQPVEAWYADDIESPSGPGNWGGLPGLVMKVNINNGSQIISPVEISAKPDVVKAPSKGKKISKDEYQKLAQEQFGNMRMRMGGGGDHGGGGGETRTVIIRQ